MLLLLSTALTVLMGLGVGPKVPENLTCSLEIYILLAAGNGIFGAEGSSTAAREAGVGSP